MSDNQYIFEVIRDIGYLILQMDAGENIAISVIKDDADFYSFRSSNGLYHGLSETAHAIEKAFEVTRGTPDPRDTLIKELEFELAQTKISLEYKTRHLASCEKALEERDAKL